jgi:nucleotide-binding universal stress UspA family protein
MLVLWAVDAIREPGTLMDHSAAVLESWASRMPIEIEPVYVLSPSQMDLTLTPEGGGLPAGVEPQHRIAAERALAQIIDQYSSSRPALSRALMTPVVLIERRSRIRAAVETLEGYAKSRSAHFVAIPTHGRHGAARFLLGSFAETLLLRAQVPTLAIGPGVEEIRGLDRLMLATDFARGSKQIFRRVVDFARELHSRIWLYHSVPNLVEPVFQSGAYLFTGAWIPARNYFNEEVQERYRRGNAWARWARNQGIECEYVMDETIGSISDHLLELIEREKIGLVALASRSGPVSSALLGSITRQVIRSASCPVWVIQPGTARIAEEKPRALAG